MQGQILNLGGPALRKKGNAERKVYNMAHTQPILRQSRSGEQSAGTDCNSICWCKERWQKWSHFLLKTLVQERPGFAVFVILNMESVPFFFHSRNWFYCSSFVVIISSGWKEVLFVHSYRCVPFRCWHFSSNNKVNEWKSPAVSHIWEKGLAMNFDVMIAKE